MVVVKIIQHRNSQLRIKSLAKYAPANMPLTVQTLNHVLRLLDRYLKLQRVASPTLRKMSLEQHKELLNQIRNGNPVKAVDALRQHIRWNIGEISDVISQSSQE